MTDALPDHLTLIMEFVPLLITIAIPIALYVSYQKAQKEARNAQKLATLLNLNYVNVADEMKSRLKEKSIFLELFAKWSPWAIAGTYKGAKVRVELVVKAIQQRYLPTSTNIGGSNPSRSSYSKGILYSVDFDNPLPFTIGIREPINMPFGLKADTLELGDQELEKMVSVSGDSDKVLEWLNSGQRKHVLIKLYQTLPSVVVDSNGLQFRDENTKVDFDRINTNLSLLTHACTKLDVTA
ncbi:MAG: hypothetical protein EP297_08465 [Gammaproteobacteria bacterium]|nr:MAG: hypothetical protein EP297_08465 [Gammaproteobacteria bacterium]